MVATLPRTPAADGFRMPGEFEPHEGCWLLWPERPDVWRRHGRPAQRAFAVLASVIARFEPVTVGVSAGQFARARKLLPPAVRVVELSAGDAWVRDTGPSFAVNDAGVVRGVHWRFNAWGGLYPDWSRDLDVAAKVLEIAGCDRYAAPLVLEGGSIHVDGQGTLIATEECLLNRNRNPKLGRAEIERHLRDYLDVRSIVWLGRGLPGDETSGHVDNLCAFVRPGEVALAWTDDAHDPFHPICRDAEARLLESRDARGRRFKVHRLPQPKPLRMTAAEARGIQAAPGTKPRTARDRLAASYVNFYIGNGVVAMPLLDPARDRAVQRQLQALFPGRQVIGVPAREILLGGGGIHCITQQQPAARRRRR